MGYTHDVLDDIRSQIDAHAEPLAEARNRLALVRSAATAFPGSLRTYASGSLAQHTFIHPVGDGDGGLVLDRRVYPRLGPDGGGETPADIAAELCGLLGPAVREVYPNARCGTSKRGPKLTFGQPTDGQDPTVDLVVALTRKDAPGLWIPNLKNDTWEASDPERHVELFTSGSLSLQRTRRRVVRLLKAWNKQYSVPGFSSHNLTVWAWEFIEPGMGMATALSTVLTKAARRVDSGNATVDPAGVSPNVRLFVPRDTASRRLHTAAAGLDEALAHDDDRDAVLSALSRVFYKYIDDPSSRSLAQKIGALRQPGPVSSGLLGLSGPPVAIPAVRSYGTPADNR
ncbi:nucleotidyltransferase family protein [Streptomyces prasinus]